MFHIHYFYLHIEKVHVGLELASETSRYRKLVVGHVSHAKTFGQWAHRCTGQTSNIIYFRNIISLNWSLNYYWKKHRILRKISSEKVKLNFFPSEIGDGWGPAVLNLQQEHDFIREGQKTFSSSRTYWIGGSVNAESNVKIAYSDYLQNDSGTKFT